MRGGPVAWLSVVAVAAALALTVVQVQEMMAARRERNVWPARSSVTKKGVPSWLPSSKTVVMPG